MRLLAPISALLLLGGLSTGLLAFQRGGYGEDEFGNAREARTYYSGDENGKSEYSWSRLRYTAAGAGGGGYGYGRWSSWSRDYPKADRQFLIALKRLTRIQARPVEQVVDLDSDGPSSIENFPWVYAVQAQTWTFTEPEAKRMREYLLKGGFLMVDDFHGATDWEHFMNGMLMVFPDRPVEDLTDKDEIFHVLYDLTERFQVPGEQYVSTGRTYEKDGYIPEWRGIKDDRGRVMVAICHNMHLGDAWEWADDPRYPEKFASLAFRLGINYVMYGMTH
ncbi:MAG: DUF4159 domain-containing protein [Acidobacteriia bacterium]|nr:DUF4159 domain-containing protein [Terriglobia bacterium]